jgi:exodeoxyribonuclease V beta subunit
MTKGQLSDTASHFHDVFDMVNAPLSGSNLIEASAGTGKTYAIAGLYVRLLLEAKFSVRDILVVTYTVAATNELIERIRHILTKALGAFKNNNSEDDFLSQLLTKFSETQSRVAALESLTRALNEFDEAAIHTIHGFCRRVLTDNAFESGELFSTELITDDQEIRLEIIEDFWRSHFYDASPEFVSYALNQNLDPGSLLKFSNENRFAGEIKMVPESEPFPQDRQDKLISELRESLYRLRDIWSAFCGEAPAIMADPSLNKQVYGLKTATIIEDMNIYLAAESPSLFPGTFFEKFSAGFIRKKTRSGFTPPAHHFFELCDKILDLSGELENLFEMRLVALRKELIATLLRELPKKKQSQNVQYFDDLLLRLRGGLSKRGKEKLISAIRSRYKAALIDEFQDTDPIQYAIVSKIFQTPENVLFLIGDPKQAIYSFRGADIFAYLSAAKEAEHIYTLNANWRSDPVLIDAFNALFSQRDSPFVFPEINYRKAYPGKTSFPERLTLDGHFEEPMRCWLIDSGEKKQIARESARKQIANATAAAIAKLVFLGESARAKIGERALQPNDIAIIVRTNKEALICENSLSKLKIPVVLHSIENLFTSPEALEMERFLWAVYLPDRDDLMLAALATDMIGKDLSFLYLLRQEEGIWEQWREKFLKYHELWEKKGLLAMFRFFLDREEIRERLLSLIDGERRLTNLLHLGELLQSQAEEKNIAMGAVVKWLVERIDHPTDNEEHQQRLETDSEAVKIVTIHKSKGLQYPVVFCPFLWGGFKAPEAPFLYHDENFAKIVDFGSNEQEAHRRQAVKEALAEEIRLFYVALTRAKSSCTFVWGAINKSGASAPAYLFHSDGEGEDTVAETETRYNKLSAGDVDARMKEIAEKAQGSIKVLKMPRDDEPFAAPVKFGAKPLVCHEFKGSIDNSWRVASFSHLTGAEARNQEYPDRDALKDIPWMKPNFESVKYGTDENDPVLSFPAGTRSGVLLHEILEKTDFTMIDDSSTLEMVGLKLRENGFAPGLQYAVFTMIRRVVDHPLLCKYGIKGKLLNEKQNDKKESIKVEQKIFLHEIPRGRRLNELEFYFPLKMISSERLGDLFAESGVYNWNHWPESFSDALKHIRFDPVRGFMKGFIDMVFQWKGFWFLVDWKSNFLGMDKENYHRDSLPDAMNAHNYQLQYYIYLLALHSYLKLRQPGYDYRHHFGGVFYLFLRGMNPAWGEDYGVFFDRPDPEQIEFLSNQMMETPDKK